MRKLAILVHRWLGVFFCLLFAMWFLSGIVMMYWSYPEVSAADRLARSTALDPSQIQVSPAEAASGAGDLVAGDIESLIQRPVYRFRGAPSQRLVYADTGDPVPAVSQALALEIASAWTGQPSAAARFGGSLTEEDQWTVSGTFRALRPLLKYSWPDGEEVYVSSVTARVEQYTTRASRAWAYLGAIPHWLYFTPLRKNGAAWSRVVIWCSGIATGAAILGLIVGVWIAVPAGRIPYVGMKHWHTWFGLVFGAVAATWAFSGMLSMDPFPLEAEDEAGPAIAGALRGGRLDISAFAAKHPREALAPHGVKQLDLALFAGEPVYVARTTAQELTIVPVHGEPARDFDHRRILDLVAKAVEPARIAEARLVTEYEAYYLDRKHELPLPVLFVRLDGAQGSMYYIDPRTARIVASYGSGGRWNRWLYHGLHSIDLPWLYQHRPAWDVVVLALLIGGASLAVTSVVLAWQFLRRKVGRAVRQAG